MNVSFKHKQGFMTTLWLTLLMLVAWSSPSQAQHNPVVVLDTSLGQIEVELMPDKAPKTVANFLNYVKRGSYDNSLFHRVIPGFVAQGGGFNADFEQISIGSLLAPSAFSEAESQEVKIQFFEDMQAHLTKITRKRREFIFCGNWAMAHKRIDVQNWQDNDSNSGFLPHEQQWMRQLFSQVGYADAFRIANTDSDEFSWWPSGTIDEGDGWRTDYQVISESLSSRVEYSAIYKNKQFSSHLPVIIDYDLEV